MGEVTAEVGAPGRAYHHNPISHEPASGGCRPHSTADGSRFPFLGGWIAPGPASPHHPPKRCGRGRPVPAVPAPPDVSRVASPASVTFREIGGA